MPDAGLEPATPLLASQVLYRANLADSPANHHTPPPFLLFSAMHQLDILSVSSLSPPQSPQAFRLSLSSEVHYCIFTNRYIKIENEIVKFTNRSYTS